MATNDQYQRIIIPAGKQVVAKLPRQLAEDYRKKIGTNLELTDEEERRLKNWLKKQIEQWEEDTAELHSVLEEDNDLSEGIPIWDDEPWEGAFRTHIPVPEMYCEGYLSIEKRAILNADVIWYSETTLEAPEEMVDNLAKVDTMINYLSRNEWDTASRLEDAFWLTNRDGLSAIESFWTEEYEPATDIITVVGEEEFKAEFPTPEDAGVSEEEFQEYLKEARSATEDDPLEIPVRFERRTYCGVRHENIELINFVTFPASVPHIKHPLCLGYGKRFEERKETILDNIRNGFYYKEKAEKLIKRKSKVEGLNRVQINQDDNEGITRGNQDGVFVNYRLTVRGRIKGKAKEDDLKTPEQKYLVVYNKKHNTLLQCMDFPFLVDNYSLFRISRRPNRLLGKSVISKTKYLSEEIDHDHNQRARSRDIAMIPSFKGRTSAQKTFDPNRDENKWKPGVIFWLENPETDLMQFAVQPTDMSSSLIEEQNAFRILDLYLGSALAVQSGIPQAGDEQAPGNKTAILLQQSNMRMEEPLEQLREGVEELGNIDLSQLFQFGPSIIEFFREESDRNGKKRVRDQLAKRFLRKGLRLRMKGVTSFTNPGGAMQELFQLYSTLMVEPGFAQNPELRFRVIRDALRAGRIANRDQYLPTAEEARQMAVEIQKEAIKQMQAEQAEAQRKAQIQAEQDARRLEAQAKRNAENGVQFRENVNG